MFFFFKQKTAYEMRISDWISDVCSSDLRIRPSFSSADPRSRTRAHREARAPVHGPCLWESSRRYRHGTAPGPCGSAELRLESSEIARASCRGRVCQYV